MANTTKREPALETEKPEEFEEASKPSKEAKAVRITVNGKASHVVHGMKFKQAPTLYKPGSLKWNDDEWEAARKDPYIVIEEVDERGEPVNTKEK